MTYITDSKSSSNNAELILFRLLLDFGLPANLKGFMYLHDAIMLVYNTPSLGQQIVKRLYEPISAKYNTSPAAVERSIRSALNHIGCLYDDTIVIEHFGYRCVPSAKTFVNTIARALHTKVNFLNELKNEPN